MNNLPETIKTCIFNMLELFKKESTARKIEHAIVIITLLRLYKTARSNGGVFKNIAKGLIRFLKKSSSSLSKKISSEIANEAAKTVNEQFQNKPPPVYSSLPSEGLKEEDILAIMRERQTHDLDPTKGKAWAYVYDHSHAHTEFTTKAHNIFIHTNCLNPMKFASLRNFEVEIVAMTAKLLHGDPLTCVGSVSSGGSESLLLAVKTYRDRLVKAHDDITQPEIIMCVSAHPAINKAAHYYGVKIVYVDSDKQTFKMRVDQVKQKITRNTCCIIVSAPSYPHGVVDPVEEISEIALAAGIPCHVDSAIGGFVLPFMEQLGRPLAAFDFRNKGVTSISSDVHKYGYSVKGASVLVFRNSELRLPQFYSYTGWPGGIYISPTTLGTRGGGPIAAAWASMMVLGQKGYVDVNRQLMEAVDYLKNEINKIDDLEVMGEPYATIIAFRAKKNSTINIFHVADAMEEISDWQVENQRFPDCIHISVMPQHLAIKEQFAADLKKAVEIVRSDPKKYASVGTAAMYGMMGKVPDEELLEEFMSHFMDQVYRFSPPIENSS